MNLVVLGTSLLWGQGLQESDKIHTLVAQMLRACCNDCKVTMTFLAHSGASTGFKPDGSVDMNRFPRIHGEVPTLYPTIVQQIEEFDNLGIRPESIDVVILDAGVNDVHITKILAPLTTPHEVKLLTEIYCHQHMDLLIRQLLIKFEKAKILIVGYYEFITEASEKAFIHTLLKAFGKLPGGFIADLALEAAEGMIKRRLLLNCDAFATQSLVAFQQVARELNTPLSGPRIFVVSPAIKAEHAAFASDSWLFGINEDFSPQDPVASIRASGCHSAGSARTQPFFCEIASAGHPNPKGAKAYAEAIIQILQEQAPS